MKAAEFRRLVERLGRRNGIRVYFEPDRGTGSHGRLHYGARFTTLKDLKKEVSEGLLAEMCKQLGIAKQDLYRR